MDIDTLTARLNRECRARREAETILEQKSRELYHTNKMIQSTANQLSQQTAQLNVILDNTQAGILLVDSNLIVVRANSYAERKFVFEVGTLFGCPVADLFAEPLNTIGDLPIARVSDGPGGSIINLTGKKVDGTLFPLELSIAETTLNEQPHSVWFIRDISRRKEEEAERIRLEQELRQAHKLEALGTLASGIAHEINTPIQFVGENLHFLEQGFADLLTRLSEPDAATGSGDEQDMDFLRSEIPDAIAQSLEGIERVREIVLSVRDFSHPGSAEPTPADINACIESTVTISRNHWKYVAELTTDLEPDLPQVTCVPGEINQVLLNLIVNAAQAIEEQGKDGLGSIAVTTKRRGGHVVIRVQDNGCGIPQKHQNRVFDPFFTTKEQGKGTGQGLSLAHGVIVQKHGGKILFESEQGQGTTFAVLLPLAPPNELKLAS